MHEEHRVNNIDQIKIKNEQEIELSEVIKPQEWEKYVNEVMNEVINNPSWLIDTKILPERKAQQISRILNNQLSSKSIKSLSEVFTLVRDQKITDAIVVRFMEVFSEKFGFTHIYRGGSLNDLKTGVSGSFTFSPDVAKGFVNQSYSEKRKKPCLFALPISALVNFYKQNSDSMGFMSEQGYDGMFNSSLQILMADHVPEDLTVYVLEGENPEDEESVEEIDRQAITEEKLRKMRERLRLKRTQQ